MHLGQSPTEYHHIDPSKLLDAVGGDVRTVASLANTFVESAPDILARLRQAAQAGDAEASRHESHTLKGMSALFNARALTEQLLQAEQAGRQGRAPGAQELAQLEASFAQALEEIRHYARTHTAAEA